MAFVFLNHTKEHLSLGNDNTFDRDSNGKEIYMESFGQG